MSNLLSNVTFINIKRSMNLPNTETLRRRRRMFFYNNINERKDFFFFFWKVSEINLHYAANTLTRKFYKVVKKYVLLHIIQFVPKVLKKKIKHIFTRMKERRSFNSYFSLLSKNPNASNNAQLSRAICQRLQRPLWLLTYYFFDSAILNVPVNVIII